MSKGASQFGGSGAPSDANRARWFLLGSVLVTGRCTHHSVRLVRGLPSGALLDLCPRDCPRLGRCTGRRTVRLLVIHADGSGLASTSGNSGRFAFAFVAGAGLVGPAGGGAAFLMLASRPKLARVGLGLFALLSAVALIWVVRNIFGWFFVGLLAAGCGGGAWRGLPKLPKLWLRSSGCNWRSACSRGPTICSRRWQPPAAVDILRMWRTWPRCCGCRIGFGGGLCALLSVAALVSGCWAFLLLSRTAEPASVGSGSNSLPTI